MGNNVMEIRRAAGLSRAQLADAAGTSADCIRLIESNKSLALVRAAEAISSALGGTIDDVFPGGAGAVSKFKKELHGPTHVSSETYELLRSVGLEGDTRRHRLKVLLRGHREAMLFDISAAEAHRLFDDVQDETDDNAGSAFVVFDSDRLRLAINLRATMFCHFLWDANIGTWVAEAEAASDDDQFNAVHVYFGENQEPTIIGVEAEDGTCEAGRSYLNRIFSQLGTGVALPNQRLTIEDEDAEFALLRVGDISLLTAPLSVLDCDERVEDEDDED